MNHHQFCGPDQDHTGHSPTGFPPHTCFNTATHAVTIEMGPTLSISSYARVRKSCVRVRVCGVRAGIPLIDVQ